MNKQFRKNTIWNIIGTTINAFNSLFLMIIVTRINGVFDAGMFTFAFSVSTLFNVIGVYAGRIYQVTDQNEFSDKDYFINRIISCMVMFIISIGFVMIKNYNQEKQIIILLLCILKMLEAFAEVLYAFFQKKEELYKVGISLTIKSLGGLFCFFITDYFTKNLILSISFFILFYILFMIFYDFRQLKLKKIIKNKTDKKHVYQIFIKGFATFAVSFLTIYLINASKYAIDNQMSDDIQAIFGIIIMPATIMILIAQFIIHPFLVMITKEIKDKNYKKLTLLIFKICVFIFGVGILGIVACYFIGIPILEFIYNIPLKKYSLCLSIILFGATFYALTSVINTVLIAMRHTMIQMVIYIVMSLVTLFLSRILVSEYEILGATLNYFFTMFSCFIIFLITYIFIIRKEACK